jgi:hypothetical protein
MTTIIAVHAFDNYEGSMPQNLVAVIANDVSAAVGPDGRIRPERLQSLLESITPGNLADGYHVYHLGREGAECEVWRWAQGSVVDRARSEGLHLIVLPYGSQCVERLLYRAEVVSLAIKS